MDSNEAFRQFGAAIKSDPWAVMLAKLQRDQVEAKLLKIHGVIAVIHTGSLARETTVGDAIHDIDMVAVVARDALPGPGDERSGSADATLRGFQALLTESGLPVDSQVRNHVVKLPGRLSVDVMPAYREGVNLLTLDDYDLRVPERRKDRWATVNPEELIELVEDRQREWQYFTSSVRMVKVWAEKNDLDGILKSALLETLVLRFMPRPGPFETLSYDEAIAGFFEAAADADIDVFYGLMLPVNLDLGPLGFAELRAKFRQGADLSRRAMEAKRDPANAEYAPGKYWHDLFGDAYPGDDIFDWIFSSPTVTVHTKEPSRSWLDWLIDCWRLLRAEGGVPDSVHDPGLDPPYERPFPTPEPGPSPGTPPFQPGDRGPEATVWTPGLFDDPAPGPETYGRP